MIGVLSLQGETASHLRAFSHLDVPARQVRTPADLAQVDALVIPGGESTTMWMLAESSGCFDAIAQRLRDGMAALGTCAGMIMLANEVLDGRPDQRTFAAIDIAVRRNAFGRQVASFEADLTFAACGQEQSSQEQASREQSPQEQALRAQEQPGEPFRAVFIRAPWVERVGPNVEVLATMPAPATAPAAAPTAAPAAGQAGNPQEVAVLCREGNVLVSSFHPELTNDLRVHQMFLDLLA